MTTKIKEENKKWYLSRTMWASVIVVVIGVLEWTQGQMNAGLPITLLGIVMAAFRLITAKKLIK